MMSAILNLSEKLFNTLRNAYESQNMNRAISKSLVVIFLVVSLLSLLVIEKNVNLGGLNKYFANPFFTIELCFVILLMFELLSLIFILPKSVSKSVGKQLELLSLIFIRGAFKEFSHIKDLNDYSFDLTNLPPAVINMCFYAIGALSIFTLLGFTNNLRKHTPISNVEADTNKFVQAKKMLSLFLLLSFLVILIVDFKHFFETGNFTPSFHTFYTMLIYSDILIVLIALRYTMNYYKIFRYSAFVVATIFIRLALSVKPYYDVLVGVFAAIFVLLLTLTYNYFLKDASKKTFKD